MKLPFLTILIVSVLALPALAQKGAKAPKAAPRAADKSHLSTSFTFDGASALGKYQNSGKGLAVVDNEKILDDLLGVRKSFKDRENLEKSRR